MHPRTVGLSGLLDDMRFYCSTSAEQLAKETYNRGHGDLSLSVDADFPPNIHDNPISANFTLKKYGIEYDLADFNESRISIRMEFWFRTRAQMRIGLLILIQPLILEE